MALLVTGFQRSGTTFLMQLCHAHPQISLTFETSIYQFVGYSFPHYCKRILSRWYHTKNHYLYDNTKTSRKNLIMFNNLLFVSRFLIDLNVQREGKVNHEAITATLRKKYPKALIVGDKWPAYSIILNKLAPLSGLKLLVIYRDCRDVTSSALHMVRTVWHKQKWAENRDTAEKIAAAWVKRMEIMERNAAAIYPIRYEDLINQPRETMNGVGVWLNVDPQFFPIDLVKKGSIGKYKDVLSASELKSVMDIAGPTMTKLGYI